MAETVTILVPFAGQLLALDLPTFEQAVARGREYAADQPPSGVTQQDRVVTAEQAAEITGVPATWFEEQMRRGTLPHLVFGKYRRLRMSELLRAVESRPASSATQAAARRKVTRGQ